MIRLGNAAMIFLIASRLGAVEHDTQSIQPFQAELQMSMRYSANAWLGYLVDSHDVRVYELRLESELDEQNGVTSWDVVLYDIGDHRRNLLAPRQWHGLQPFMISAEDFAPNVQTPIYGRERTLRVTDRHLVVTITIHDAKVAQGAGAGTRVFAELNASLKVNTL